MHWGARHLIQVLLTFMHFVKQLSLRPLSRLGHFVEQVEGHRVSALSPSAGRGDVKKENGWMGWDDRAIAVASESVRLGHNGAFAAPLLPFRDGQVKLRMSDYNRA